MLVLFIIKHCYDLMQMWAILFLKNFIDKSRTMVYNSKYITIHLFDGFFLTPMGIDTPFCNEQCRPSHVFHSFLQAFFRYKKIRDDLEC